MAPVYISAVIVTLHRKNIEKNSAVKVTLGRIKVYRCIIALNLYSQCNASDTRSVKEL